MSETWERALKSPWGLAVGIYAVAWGFLCSPWLLGGLTIPYDAKAHFQAQLQFLANALHSGQSPFWTPNVFAGSPQIADPQSLIFSPAFFIAYFNPSPSFATVDAYIFALVGLGGLAVLLFFKDRGWHPAGGLVAALCFSFGASAAWRVQHVGQVESFAMFGVTLWLLGRTLGKPTKIRGALTGVSAALMLIEPDQVALLASYILAGFVAADIIQSNTPIKRLSTLVPALASAASVCIALVAVPLVLTYFFVETSSRAAIPFSAVAHGSLHPASLLTSVVGDLFGAMDPKVPYWGPYSYAWDKFDQTLSQNMGQIYIGALPMLLFLTIGVCRGLAWDKEIRYFTLALAAMTVYAIGAFTPIFRIFYELAPGVSFFRRPADATFLMGGLLSIVAGYLVHRLSTESKTTVSNGRRAVELSLIAIFFALSTTIAFQQGHLIDSIKPMVIAIAFLCLAAASVAWIARSSPSAKRSLIAVGFLMTVDLAVNNGPNESTALPMSRYDFLRQDTKNETIVFLKERLKTTINSVRRDRIELVGLGFEWPNASLVHGFEHILGYNPLRLDATVKGLGAGETVAGWDQRQFSPLFPSYHSRLADLLGLRYIASSVPIDRIDKHLKADDLKLVARTRDAYIYENASALPRVMVVDNWLEADFKKLLETGAWPLFDPKKTLLLEQAPPLETTVAAKAALRAAGWISIERYENTVVVVDVTATNQTFLLSNTMWHPWWRATIDGVPAPILKANVLFQAVQLSAGHHIVEFRFEPLEGAWDQLFATRSGVPVEKATEQRAH